MVLAESAPRVCMEHPRHTTGNLREVLTAVAMGYRCVPCLPGTKVPAVKWKRFQGGPPTEADYRAWFGGMPMNVAVLTGEAVVVDCDSPDAVDVVLDRCGRTPTVCRTPRGGYHLWYRRPGGVVVGNRVRVEGRPIDVRGEGGLALIPPSRTASGAYAWLGPLRPAADLPVAAIDWARNDPRPLRPVALTDDGDLTVRRARAYLAHVEGAISGQRGHDRTMRVAGILVQKFRLSVEQALPLILEWNEQCEPPWSEKELLHKLRDAYRLRYRYSTSGS